MNQIEFKNIMIMLKETGGEMFYKMFIASNKEFEGNVWRNRHPVLVRRGGNDIQRMVFGYIPSMRILRELSDRILFKLFMKKIKYTAIFIVD